MDNGGIWPGDESYFVNLRENTLEDRIRGLEALVGTIRAHLPIPTRNVSDISPEEHSHEILNAIKEIAEWDLINALAELRDEQSKNVDLAERLNSVQHDYIIFADKSEKVCCEYATQVTELKKIINKMKDIFGLVLKGNLLIHRHSVLIKDVIDEAERRLK